MCVCEGGGQYTKCSKHMYVMQIKMFYANGIGLTNATILHGYVHTIIDVYTYLILLYGK